MVDRGYSFLEHRESGPPLLRLAFELFLLCAVRRAPLPVVEFGAPQGEPVFFDVVVDGSYLVDLDFANRFPAVDRLIVGRVQRIQGYFFARDPAAVERQSFDKTDERAPLPALDEEYAGRRLGPGHLMRHRPLEVLVVDVEIPDPVERAARKPVRLPDGAPGFRVDSFQLILGGAKALRAKRLAGDAPAVLERHHLDGSRVERHDAVPQDEREKTDNHQYAQSERTAHYPDEGLAPGLEIE